MTLGSRQTVEINQGAVSLLDKGCISRGCVAFVITLWGFYHFVTVPPAPEGVVTSSHQSPHLNSS